MQKLPALAQHSIVPPRAHTPLHAMPTSCGHQRLIAGDEYEWHGLRRGRAEFVVFQYTVAGLGRLRYESRETALVPGACMLVCIPHDHCYYLPADSEEWQFLYVCMTGSEVIRLCREIIRGHGPVLDLGMDTTPLDTLVKIIEMAETGDFHSAYTASTMAYRLAMDILDFSNVTDDDHRIPVQLKRACEYCKVNFRGMITVDDIAHAAHWSKAHFTRQFKKFMHMTPIEYLIELRLREAMRLLRETELTLKEIAPLCGFPDGNYLCRVFGRKFGITPGGFRRTGMYLGN